MIELNEEIRDKICRSLLKYDHDIVEIVEFGSSVYAPEYARDLDLLVITKDKKEYGGYLDYLDELNLSFDVDVVVKGEDERLKSNFACQILGAFEVLYGDGSNLEEMTKNFDPSYEEARTALESGKMHMKDSKGLSGDLKARYIRNAFNELFHAARIAAMVHLAIEDTRWGRIKRRLRRPYREEFEEFINVLHIDYFYNGNYPENYEDEFERWYKRVKDFIRRLEGRRR